MYNGHKNWNHWNVALWLFNDYDLYQRLQRLKRRYTRDGMARILASDYSGQRTPDGAPYTFTSIRAALTGDW